MSVNTRVKSVVLPESFYYGRDTETTKRPGVIR